MHRFAGVAGALVMTVLAAAAAPALAQSPPSITVPIFGHFRSVLAQGEGTQLNGADFLQYQASGNPPASYTSQTPLYVGSELHAPSFQPPAGVSSVVSPAPASGPPAAPAPSAPMAGTQ